MTPVPIENQRFDQLPNPINQNLLTTELNQKLITDITYIYTVLDG